MKSYVSATRRNSDYNKERHENNTTTSTDDAAKVNTETNTSMNWT